MSTEFLSAPEGFFFPQPKNPRKRHQVSYWDEDGKETIRWFAAEIEEADIPDMVLNIETGKMASRDLSKPPGQEKNEPYKTHLDYVKERRSEEDGVKILEVALQKLRKKRSGGEREKV